jgi:V/A-type H+-transporting ATPase subunit B
MSGDLLERNQQAMKEIRCPAHFFLRRFEDAGVFARTVMYVNLASDPVVERLLVPDLALAVAERFAVEECKRVLVLLTDMTAYTDAMKDVGIAMDAVPSHRGATRARA